MRTLGSQASAMAIMARWRMPPDISCGYWLARRAGSGMPTSSSMAMARAWAAGFDSFSCSITTSAICAPMVWTGLRLVMGS